MAQWHYDIVQSNLAQMILWYCTVGHGTDDTMILYSRTWHKWHYGIVQSDMAQMTLWYCTVGHVTDDTMILYSRTCHRWHYDIVQSDMAQMTLWHAAYAGHAAGYRHTPKMGNRPVYCLSTVTVVTPTCLIVTSQYIACLLNITAPSTFTSRILASSLLLQLRVCFVSFEQCAMPTALFSYTALSKEHGKEEGPTVSSWGHRNEQSYKRHGIS